MAFSSSGFDWCSQGDGDSSAPSWLDMEFASTMRRVEAALQGAPRSIRIRGEQWVQKLALLAWVPQEEFARDRNLHAELLLQCVEECHWHEPLDRHPPVGPLPKLPPYIVHSMKRRRQERAELARLDHGVASDGQLASASTFVTSPGSAAFDDHISPDLSLVESMPAEVDDDLRDLEKCRDELAAARRKLRDTVAASNPMAASVCVRPVRTDASADSSRSLAGLAAHAMGTVPASGTAGGVSAPLAYSLLAARVAHLQDENRRLRKQLKATDARAASAGRPAAFSKQRRARPSSGGRVRSTSAARARGPFAGVSPPALAAAARETQAARPPSPCWQEESFASVPQHAHSAASARSAGYVAGSTPSWESPPRQPNSPRRRSPSPSIHGRTPPPLPFGLALPSTSSVARSPKTLGPAPPDGDTDAFLRYLDAFQEHTDRLCGSATRQPVSDNLGGSGSEAYMRFPRSGL
mmetsp:Transcript_70032/g.121205  ORF Transcript_70032/g.121205 Transcript_70032/m.121205 type:complete len:467 (+) Transcript_70032:111-1511(+)